MDYEISLGEQKEDFRRSVGVKIKRSVYNDRLRSAVQSLVPRVSINGFRKGKAPVNVIEKMYGESLRGEVIDKIWQDALNQAIADNSLEVVQVSNLHVHDNDPEKDLTIHAEFTLRPRPELKNLDGLEVSFETEKYSDELLEEAISEILRNKAKRTPIVERVNAQDKDLANISFEETVEGEESPRPPQEGSYVEIGSGRSITDLEQGLIGQKIGEEKEITVKYPEDYQDTSLAGKTSKFKVKVNSLEQVETPELTDEFVKAELQQDLSAEGFKESIVKRLKTRITERTQEAKMVALLTAIAEANPFTVPEIMIDEQIRMSLFNMKVLDPKKREDHHRDVSTMRGYLGGAAREEVVRAIILDQLVEQLKVEASDSDVDTWLNKQAETYDTTPEDIRAQFTSGQGDDARLKNIVARERAAEQIIKRSKVTEVEKGTRASGDKSSAKPKRKKKEEKE